MLTVVNLRAHPVVLEDGTVLAAAGTPGSSKEIATVSEGDRRRLVEREFIRVIEVSTAKVSERANDEPVASKKEKL